ncbi:probable C-mannosyltransferase DPY19L1 [Haliotis rufescens]|uniref:probable C-mannosyltransferase DPY19L1 n=1 Tax=Haliotis rufescens TaxID=6454 RepID=UPI00201F2605|nr:probable C-mannosyltransferase DPY19L1 [Haliotis rufescens]
MAGNRRQGSTGDHRSSFKHGKSKYNRSSESREREKENGNSTGIVYKLFLVAVAIGIAVTHRNHIATMFEKDRHFSHLSTLERELAFRTEMGLYYSYFKTLIHAPSFMEGLNQIMYDNVTEYPQTINVLKRFNLYPEVALSIGYRIYEDVNARLNRQTKMCWQVNRGEGKTPVQSCEGMGEPSYFYVESAFALNGIMMGIFFLFGTYLSDRMIGGILTVACYFFNHGEATRVQWTPPLRESFAYPFLVFQMLLVTFTLRCKSPNIYHSVAIALASVCFMLPWQFAQFALLTQAMSVMGTYVLQYIDDRKLKVILSGQSLGLAISYVLLFGNEMLLTSFYASCLISMWIILFLRPVLDKLHFKIIIMAVQSILLAIGTVCSKIVVGKLLNIADDAHIGEIFRSKFSDFKNFHTMLYTCAKEFDFIEEITIWKFMWTLLLPCSMVVFVTAVFFILKSEYSQWKNPVVANGSAVHANTAESQGRNRPDAELVYHLFQQIAFATMAIMIMRLKLFWTPHLCLLTSLLASKKYFGWCGRKEAHFAMLAVVLAGMAYTGIQNLQQQWSIMGEFSNYPMEDLVDWINDKTPKNAVFAGPMPTMATIKLCTHRPIVNHPHYEDAGLRERTKVVYSIFSRKPGDEVVKGLKELKVDYVIYENSWCVRRTKEGCSMPEIWDTEDIENRGKTPFCDILRDHPEPYFKQVYMNPVYQVLQIV